MALENGHDDREGNQNTVLIDTSLETHLAMIVNDSDTVSDLKRKILLEHRQCFPGIGDIEIHSVKVKRRGIYYHLSDSMPVKSAFGATQKNWFLSVDASHIEQLDGIRHNSEDNQHQLALPWVTDSLSNDKHDNVRVDRPSNPSLIHGSTSNHHNIVPFLNQKVPSVDHFTSDDSCKKDSKNIEEDRSSKQVDAKLEELYSVDKEIKSKKRIGEVHNEDDCVKKRLKTVKCSEEDRGLADGVDMVKGMGTSVNDENSIEDKSKFKETAFDGVVIEAMNDEHTRSVLVSQKKPKRTKKTKKDKKSQTNTKESEVVPDVEMVLETNIQQETPFQPSEKEKCNELVKESDIGNEIPSSIKGVTVEDELQVKPADDLVVDEKMIDEQKNEKTDIIIDEKSEVLEKTLVDDSLVDNSKDDNLIVKEMKIPEASESHRIKEKKRSKKKDVRKSSKKDEVINHGNNDTATGTNENNLLPPSERKESLEITSMDALHVDKDGEISKNETKTSQQNAEKPKDNMDDSKKTKKKTKMKTKKSGTRNEKIADGFQSDVDKLKSNDPQISNEVLLETPKNNHSFDLPRKLELESAKSKTPQVPKGNMVNSTADIPNEGSREIDFMEYFSPTQQPDNLENGKDTKLSVKEKKPKKKPKQQDNNAIQSLPRNENNKESLVSKKVPEASTDKLGDENISNNINKTKTPKKIDNKTQPSESSFGRSFKSEKITKQQAAMGVKNMKKSAPLLNAPGTIFGSDSDEDDSTSANDNGKTVNSDSSTRTPSGNSSSSGESDSSIDSRRYAMKRKEGSGKNNMNSQLKSMSMADILRSSSRFKKAKVSASQQVVDTESELVDFVPESQPRSFSFPKHHLSIQSKPVNLSGPNQVRPVEQLLQRFNTIQIISRILIRPSRNRHV
ncbi:hypothetical protein LXL04_020727 [Taraxacum kok-saghyz]